MVCGPNGTVFCPLEDSEALEMGKMSEKLPSPPERGVGAVFGLKNAKLGPPEASWGHSPVEIVLLGVLWA